MTRKRLLGFILAAFVGMTGGSFVNGRVASAEEEGDKQCFYYPPNPPSCAQCGPQACFGSGYLCCTIKVE